MDTQYFDAMRGVGLGVVFLLIVMAERIHPHARMQRPWQTNMGLWLVDTTLTRVVCGACGLVVAAWAIGTIARELRRSSGGSSKASRKPKPSIAADAPSGSIRRTLSSDAPRAIAIEAGIPSPSAITLAALA